MIVAEKKKKNRAGRWGSCRSTVASPLLCRWYRSHALLRSLSAAAATKEKGQEKQHRKQASQLGRPPRRPSCRSLASDDRQKKKPTPQTSRPRATVPRPGQPWKRQGRSDSSALSICDGTAPRCEPYRCLGHFTLSVHQEKPTMRTGTLYVGQAGKE